MKTLIVDDDFTCRLLLQKMLDRYGECHIAANGREAVEAVRAAILTGKTYDLICLDIMMPEMDGQAALKEIRRMEKHAGILDGHEAKIVMTTAMGFKDAVMESIRGQCNWYLIKPIDQTKIVGLLKELKLID